MYLETAECVDECGSGPGIEIQLVCVLKHPENPEAFVW